jgi:hypothetical protein
MTDDPENPLSPANLQGISQEVGYKKPPKDKQFKKGYDPRRNSRAVPKETLLIREKMRMIAAEVIGNDENAMTRFEAMLRQLWTSRNPAHNKLALQVLDPKILQEHVDVTSGGDKVELVVIYDKPKTSDTPTDPA